MTEPKKSNPMMTNALAGAGVALLFALAAFFEASGREMILVLFVLVPLYLCVSALIAGVIGYYFARHQTRQGEHLSDSFDAWLPGLFVGFAVSLILRMIFRGWLF